MRSAIFCLLLLCPILNIAQSSKISAPLKIGTIVPDTKFKKVLNASYKTTNIYAFSDKLLLIDFWATWCAPCIKEFPKLDSLQAKFKDRLQVLLVNNPKSGDDEKKINELLEKKRTPSGKKFSLPIILNDEQLAKWFPHFGIPHTVWIYKGKVVAITGAMDVTAANIQTVIENRILSIETKEDQMDFDDNKPLIENGNGGSTSSILYKSLFTSFLNGARGSVGQETSTDNSIKRKYFINKPLLFLYSYVFPQLPNNRVILDESLYPLVICDTISTRWIKYHCFSYEQTFPFNMSLAQQQRFMQADLDRQFGLFSRLEKKRIKCYVLVLTDSLLLTRSYTNATGEGLLKLDNGFWVLKNSVLSNLLMQLNWQSSYKPLIPVVLDETGYNSKVDIEFKLKNLHDLPALQKLLPAFGLELIEVERDVEMLVISKSKE